MLMKRKEVIKNRRERSLPTGKGLALRQSLLDGLILALSRAEHYALFGTNLQFLFGRNEYVCRVCTQQDESRADPGVRSNDGARRKDAVGANPDVVAKD